MTAKEVFDKFYEDRIHYISDRWARQLKYYIDFWKENITKDPKEVLLSLNVSNYTRNRYLLVLNAVKRWAEKRGLEFNVKIPPFFPDDRIKRPLPESWKLEKVIEYADGELKALLLLLKNTLARVGELLELKWKDVDFENRVIYLRTRKTGGRGIKNMVIPLNDEAYQVLRSLPRKSEYVFSGKGRNRRMGYRWRSLKRVCDMVGIEPLGFHVFRHHAATSLVKKGVPLTVIQSLCGHSSIRTTERYLHANLEDLRKAVELLK